MSVEMPPEIQDNIILREKAWKQMHELNENYVAAVVGQNGSGKSWAALRLAETIDPNFTVDQVAFSVEEFLRLVIDDSYGQGSIIVFEEASVEAGHKNWWSKGNRILAQVLDTWRHQNRGVIFTLPAFGKLDKDARGRCHALIQMHEKHPQQGYTIAKYKYLQQDSDSGKLYRHYLTRNDIEYRTLKINKPSKELRDAYEPRKEQYTNELNRGLLEELLEAQQEKKEKAEKQQSPKDIANDILDKDAVDEYISTNNGVEYLDRDLIAVEYGIGDRRSKKVKKVLMKECDLDVM